ncbi:MAG: hypothetical protein ACOX5A_06110 [Aminivibrio sp.]|nr:hypothetical protein [Synergistaceae bacterium]
MAISSGTERVRRNGAKTPLLMRRVLHDCERRSLSLEAQGIVYRCLAGEEVELEVIERAIQEAVSISFLKHSSVDAPLFEAIMDAVMDDVSFEIPGSPAGRAYAQSSRVC